MENRAHAFMTGIFTLTLLVAAVLFGIWFNRDRVEYAPYLLATNLSVPGLNPQAAVILSAVSSRGRSVPHSYLYSVWRLTPVCLAMDVMPRALTISMSAVVKEAESPRARALLSLLAISSGLLDLLAIVPPKKSNKMKLKLR